MKAKLAAIGVLLIALVLLACPATAQPSADYGDAPDPNFPSLFASNGPHHTTLTDCYVGWTSTPEPDAHIVRKTDPQRSDLSKRLLPGACKSDNIARWPGPQAPGFSERRFAPV